MVLTLILSGGELERQRLGVTDDRVPGGDGKAETGDRLNCRNRCDVEYAAAAARLHVWHRRPAHAHHVHQIALDRLLPRAVVEREQVAQRRRAVVVDENIDPAVMPRRFLR